MEILSRAEFISKAGNNLAAVLFYTSQQPQSDQMATVLEMLREEHQFGYYRVCLDNRMLEARHDWDPIKITTSPLVVLFEGHKEVGRVEGADPPQLVILVKNLFKGQSNGSLNQQQRSNVAAVEKGDPVDYKATSRKQVELLIRSSPVVLFMNGSKQVPLCDASKYAVEILDSMDIDFKEVDVSLDQLTQECLKEISQSSTLPQLYVKGTCIGGVDLMDQMFQCGDLHCLLGEFRSQQSTSYFRSLVNLYPIMVFMKGERQQPFCKFSRALLELFDQSGITDFRTFNILKNEDIRCGLKNFSCWPTYPQIYVKGELLGGVDIVKELLEVGGPQALIEEIERLKLSKNKCST